MCVYITNSATGFFHVAMVYIDICVYVPRSIGGARQQQVHQPANPSTQKATHHFEQQLKPHLKVPFHWGVANHCHGIFSPQTCPCNDSQTESIARIWPGFHHKATQVIKQALLRFISLAFAKQKKKNHLVTVFQKFLPEESILV